MYAKILRIFSRIRGSNGLQMSTFGGRPLQLAQTDQLHTPGNKSSEFLEPGKSALDYIGL